MKLFSHIWFRAAFALLLASVGLFGEPVHTARASFLVPPAKQGSTITYDYQGIAVYDASQRFPFGYDGTGMHTECEGQPVSTHPHFTVFAKFLAAEGSSPQGEAPQQSPNGSSSWQQYEQQNGSQQTAVQTVFQGETITVRLDNPPVDSAIVDYKNYNWSNPAYQTPFIQEQVVNDFQTQIQKYQTIAPNVNLQFSQQPPSWVVEAIQEVGGTYSVKP